jgi:hypothetical protein
MSSELTISDVIGWTNHPFTQLALYPMLKKRKGELEKQLRKSGAIDSLQTLDNIQRELDLIDKFLDEPSKLLKHLQTAENPAEQRDF